MAKISFLKLGLNKDTSIMNFYWSGNTVEVKQYLPIQNKLDLIANVINNCQDENNFINNAKLDMYFDLEIIYEYTNINFTEKQKEDSFKLYDLLYSSGFIKGVFELIPKNEISQLKEWTISIAHNIYDYRNSVYAILDSMKTDYNSLEFNSEEIKENLSNGENIQLVKDILTNLG